MICPHCATTVKLNWELIGHTHPQDKQIEIFIKYDNCPSCGEIIIFLIEERYLGTDLIGRIQDGKKEQMIYPSKSKFDNLKDIPKDYLEDYQEAINVLAPSPKASAALTRRLLQNILREEFKIENKSLAGEIQEFINLPGIPSHLSDAVDAVRNVGNLAAHPSKNKNTGEIVKVEPGEAEWLIEVIEALFDFVFIQPKKLEKRQKELNIKLKGLGKPEMKKSN